MRQISWTKTEDDIEDAAESKEELLKNGNLNKISFKITAKTHRIIGSECGRNKREATILADEHNLNVLVLERIWCQFSSWLCCRFICVIDWQICSANYHINKKTVLYLYLLEWKKRCLGQGKMKSEENETFYKINMSLLQVPLYVPILSIYWGFFSGKINIKGDCSWSIVNMLSIIDLKFEMPCWRWRKIIILPDLRDDSFLILRVFCSLLFSRKESMK